ncbi:MAG: potassium/proton antiporter [Chitinophagaceae bacterium]|nr:potassium/proton antiporter [Chitinophagaceae bacterium]
MHFDVEHGLLVASILLLLSILGGKTTSRWGVPTLIFFLLVGILAGSEGIGGIPFDDPHMAQFIGITALNFILFSGGLSTDWHTIRPVIRTGLALSTLGVLLTAVSVGVFVHYLLGFTFPEGLLLGSIVSSTDAAAVFSILRGKGIGLKGALRPVLELESGSNDPMAYFLTISLTAVVKEGHFPAGELLLLFVKGFLIGGAMGYCTGKLSFWLINRIQLNNQGLYPVLLMALAMFSYAATEFLGGNGFLAIYICAVVLGSSNFIHKRSLIQFYDGIAWLMQIILFLALGLLVFPSKVLAVAWDGLLISAFLILIARPIGVFGSLLFNKANRRSKLFLSWVGLRGAVPIVFATYPKIAGLAQSDMIFNLVFFIAVTSVIIQGTTLPAVAKMLHLIVPGRAKRRMGSDLEFIDPTMSVREEILLPHHSVVNGRRIVEINFPKTAKILLVVRGKDYITPVGSTVLRGDDKLLILAENERAFSLAMSSLGMAGS